MDCNSGNDDDDDVEDYINRIIMAEMHTLT